MKKLLILLFILAAAILQVIIGKTGPNLILVLFLIFTIFKGFERTWGSIVLIGLFLDFFSGLLFGSITLSLIISCFIIDWFNHKVFLEVKLWTSLILVALGSLIYYFILVISYFSLNSHYLFSSFFVFLMALLYNLLFAIIIFYVVKKVLN